MADLGRVDARQNAGRVTGDDRLGPPSSRQILDLSDNPRKVEGSEIVFRLFDRNQGQRGQRDAIGLKTDRGWVGGDPAFDIESRRSHGQMEEGALAVAEIVETTLAACLIGMEDNFDLANEFREPQVERPENGRRIGAGAMHLLPAPFDGRRHEIDRSLAAECSVQGGAGLGKDVPNLLRPIDGAPEPAAQEGGDLGGAVANRGHIDHLDASAVDRLQLDAIGLRELAKRADRPELLFDRTVERAVLGPGRLQP
jgi:hypothetical protein